MKKSAKEIKAIRQAASEKAAITREQNKLKVEIEELSILEPISKVNEKNIRVQKVADNFQRYAVAAGMMKDGFKNVDIVERLMSENGIYAGVEKAKSEKSTKNFVGKIRACFNAYNEPDKNTVIAGHMRVLAAGRVPRGACASYAKLTFLALQ